MHHNAGGDIVQPGLDQSLVWASRAAAVSENVAAVVVADVVVVFVSRFSGMFDAGGVSSSVSTSGISRQQEAIVVELLLAVVVIYFRYFRLRDGATWSDLDPGALW